MVLLHHIIYKGKSNNGEKIQKVPSHLGIEPRTFGLEVQRAILCANGTIDIYFEIVTSCLYMAP